MDNIEKMSDVVDEMNHYLRNTLRHSKKKLWENTYIKHQIDNREQGREFSLEDHIRGMVYSMLSSGITWERVESGIDENTGRILPVDEIFHQYEPDYLLNCTPEFLTNKIKEIHCGSQSTKKQMIALIRINIPKLQKIKDEFGSIDGCFNEIIKEDDTKKTLVKKLSTSSSELKMSEMGEALIAEYLRNVGYDMAKPDRHIRRILGKDVLGCSEHSIVPIYEAMDIIREISEYSEKYQAEIDYILWSYCAKGYGEVCTKRTPHCEICPVPQIMNCKGEKICQKTN